MPDICQAQILPHHGRGREGGDLGHIIGGGDLDHVHADKRAEEVWHATRTDPAAYHAVMQKQWDERPR